MKVDLLEYAKAFKACEQEIKQYGVCVTKVPVLREQAINCYEIVAHGEAVMAYVSLYMENKQQYHLAGCMVHTRKGTVEYQFIDTALLPTAVII